MVREVATGADLIMTVEFIPASTVPDPVNIDHSAVYSSSKDANVLSFVGGGSGFGVGAGGTPSLQRGGTMLNLTPASGSGGGHARTQSAISLGGASNGPQLAAPSTARIALDRQASMVAVPAGGSAGSGAGASSPSASGADSGPGGEEPKKDDSAYDLLVRRQAADTCVSFALLASFQAAATSQHLYLWEGISNFAGPVAVADQKETVSPITSLKWVPEHARLYSGMVNGSIDVWAIVYEPIDEHPRA